MPIDYFEQFKIEYKLRLAPKTIQGYQITIRQLQDQMDKPFDKISRKDIRKWLMLLEENHYSPISIRNKLIGLKTFYRYCVEDGLIDRNPTLNIPFPKVPERVPIYLTKSQLAQLRGCVESSLVERAIIEVFIATGVRMSELVSMKIQDLNESERSIHIPNGKGNQGRIVLISLKSFQYVKAYLASRTDALPYLFVNQSATNSIRAQKINANFRRYSERVGFRVIPHMLRHTFTAQLAQKGMPLEAIQQLLGHQTTSTTQLYARLYNHARKETYDKWM